MNDRLLERLRVVPAAVPIDTTGAAVAGDWVNLKFYRRVLVVIQQGAWAGGTPALTFEQAQDNAGTGAKTLASTERWNATALTDDLPEKAAVSSNTSNLANAANGLTLVEFHAQDLDIANGFTHLRVNVASPGANADLIAAFYILGDPSYAGKPDTLPSAIA